MQEEYCLTNLKFCHCGPHQFGVRLKTRYAGLSQLATWKVSLSMYTNILSPRFRVVFRHLFQRRDTWTTKQQQGHISAKRSPSVSRFPKLCWIHAPKG